MNLIIELLITLVFLRGKIKPYLKPTMLISLTLAWFVTNGWAYALAFIPHGITWLTAIATTYIGILFLPFTIEKPITFWIAIRIQRLLFVQSTITQTTTYNWWYKWRLHVYYRKYKGGNVLNG